MTGAEIAEVFHAACAYRNERLASQLVDAPDSKKLVLPPLSDQHWEHALALFGVDVVDGEDEAEVELVKTPSHILMCVHEQSRSAVLQYDANVRFLRAI